MNKLHPELCRNFWWEFCVEQAIKRLNLKDWTHFRKLFDITIWHFEIELEWVQALYNTVHTITSVLFVLGLFLVDMLPIAFILRPIEYLEYHRPAHFVTPHRMLQKIVPKQSCIALLKRDLTLLGWSRRRTGTYRNHYWRGHGMSKKKMLLWHDAFSGFVCCFLFGQQTFSVWSWEQVT